MREKYVIAYYGSQFTKVYTNGDFKDVYIGEGIVHESEPMDSAPVSPVSSLVKLNEPKDKEYRYAVVEKRYYPE